MKRVLASLLLLVGCGHGTRPNTLPVRIAVGGRTQLIYLAATLAQELGYYRDEGLEITFQDFPGGAKALEALLGGSSDVVCGFYDHTIQMAAQGRELRAFVSILRYLGLVAVATKPEIRRIEDLKGKIVGVSAPGSSTHLFLNYLLVTHGLKPEDVSTPSIGMGATAVSAISRGNVDAAVMSDPSIDVARKQTPALHVLADARTAEGVRQIFGVETYPSTVLYSTAEWLASHPEHARRLARALAHTIDWMRTHSAEEILQRMPPDFRTGDAEIDLEGVRATRAMLSPDGKLNHESADAVRKVLSVSLAGVRTAAIDLDRTYTNEYLGR